MGGRAFVSRFSPNRTDPALLEAIFVQRHTLAEVWLERLTESALGGVIHLLAVGPRGCGKSHLVALLLSRLRKDPEVNEQLRIAWLPEDETTTSFWKFLLRIFRALNTEYGEEFPPPPRDELDKASDEHRTVILSNYLLQKLGEHNLLVVVENLDNAMNGLKLEGQKRWRAFLQEHPVTATLATSQQLTKDVSDRARPFFNFFQIERLQPLTSDEALLLLQKLADQGSDEELREFLKTATGRARVRAIRHLTGGNHRVFIILSEFATKEKLDDLVSAFEELLDELTPYYQERLRWLPDQQREIIEFLCRQVYTVTVKEIAEYLFLSEQAVAAQLKSLKNKGYATSARAGRESRYELSEPLMRLCVEVKDTQREPIRLIVEFLRIWYDREGIEDRLRQLPADSELERRYFDAVLKAHKPEIPGPVEEALIRDLEMARSSGETEEVVRVLVELAATALTLGKALAFIKLLQENNRPEEVLAACERAIEIDSNNDVAFLYQGNALGALGSYHDSLTAFDHAIRLDPSSSAGHLGRGVALNFLERYEEAILAYNRSIELDPQESSTWKNKAISLVHLRRFEEALIAIDRSISLETADDQTLELRTSICDVIDQANETLEIFSHAIKSGESSQSVFALLALCNLACGKWSNVERAFIDLFRTQNPGNIAETLPLVIANIHDNPFDSEEWIQRITRLTDIAEDAHADWERTSTEIGSKTYAPPNPFALIGDALVQSLTNKIYAVKKPEALDSWAKVWQEIAKQHPELSLASRLFSVGSQYIHKKDERVLLDLVREERTILRDLFGLED